MKSQLELLKELIIEKENELDELLTTLSGNVQTGFFILNKDKEEINDMVNLIKLLKQYVNDWN